MTGRVGKMQVRNGRYNDGKRSWQRTSTMLKNIETDTFNLDEWRENTLAFGLSQRPDLTLAVAAAYQLDERGKLTRESKDTLRGLRKQAADAAKSKAGSNSGTAVHTATERVDMGESVERIGLPYPFDDQLRAYEALKNAMGLQVRPEHIERTVRNTPTDSAGTFDKLMSSAYLVEMGILAEDELIVTDVKTESDPLLNLIHIAPQLADYAYADGMFVPAPTADDECAGYYEPMPKISKKVGLVIHLRDGAAVPYLVDLEAGWLSTQRAAAQREALKASKVKLGEPGCWAFLVPVIVPAFRRPASAEVAAAAAQHAADRGGQKCLVCSKPEPHVCKALGTPVTQVAVTRPDGMVTWQPEQPLAVAHGALDEVDKSAISAIWQAPDLASLAETYRIYTEVCGRTWSGRVAEAAEARRRQVECVQRSMHTTGRCACGWTEPLAP